MTANKNNLDRREFLKQSAVATAAIAVGLDVKSVYAAKRKQTSVNPEKKVIVIGIDGMDPHLTELMMGKGRLPNFTKLHKQGGTGGLVPASCPKARWHVLILLTAQVPALMEFLISFIVTLENNARPFIPQLQHA